MVFYVGLCTDESRNKQYNEFLECIKLHNDGLRSLNSTPYILLGRSNHRGWGG
jgi:hypothetical protein